MALRSVLPRPCLTAAGSAYYHLAPDNERLFWDRLPMMIAFMSLIAAQVVDRISVRAGLVLLIPMLLTGLASVVYWIATERAGAGNLMPYVVLQGYAVVMLLVLALLYPSRYTRSADVYWVFAAYVIAKIFELLDREVFAFGNLVSGHPQATAAAVAGLIICRTLWLRSRPAHGAGVRGRGGRTVRLAMNDASAESRFARRGRDCRRARAGARWAASACGRSSSRRPPCRRNSALRAAPHAAYTLTMLGFGTAHFMGRMTDCYGVSLPPQARPSRWPPDTCSPASRLASSCTRWRRDF
jgi:hypothetical protein